MTEGDILGEFGAIEEKKMYLLSGAFLKKLARIICETNPIGPNTQDTGTPGTQIIAATNGIPDPPDKTKAWVFVYVPGSGAIWAGPSNQDSSLYLFSIKDTGTYGNGVNGVPPFGWIGTDNCSGS